MITDENRQYWKKKGQNIKPPKPNVIRKEAYRVFEQEYWFTHRIISYNLKKKWIILTSVEAVMKATRVLDALKRLEE